MNEFVEECRREWSRLGVPETVANEMAADLTTDLEEAAADGVPSEEVLGSGASDARAFAAAWAAERGVTRPLTTNHRLRRLLTGAALTTLALVTILGAVLVIASPPDTPTRLAIDAPVGLPPAVRVIAPAPPEVSVTPDGVTTAAVWVVRPNEEPVLLPAPSTRLVGAEVDDSSVRNLGWVLLAVGLSGVVCITIVWVGAQPGRRPRPGEA